jgi:hypothetical protein
MRFGKEGPATFLYGSKYIAVQLQFTFPLTVLRSFDQKALSNQKNVLGLVYAKTELQKQTSYIQAINVYNCPV